VRLALSLLLLAGCRGPDYLEVSPWASEGAIASARQEYDTDSYGAMLTVGWSVGQTGRAMANLAELDVSKSGELLIRERDPHHTPSVLTVAPGAPPDTGSGTGGDTDHALYGLGAALAGLAGMWKLGRKGGDSE